jgi:S-adenosylmethionine synthetase
VAEGQPAICNVSDAPGPSPIPAPTAGLAQDCAVPLSHSIGIARPVSVRVRTFGSNNLVDHAIAARVNEIFDFPAAAIVRDLALRELPGRHDVSSPTG